MHHTIKLSERLEKIASFIPKAAKFADIGSDHAYLPSYVCLHDAEVEAIAGEVNMGPFQSAQETVKHYDLSDRIDVRLGNGLDVLKGDEVDSIVIAGMGGSLIRTILEEGTGRMDRVTRIITQPNVGERNVRYWLNINGYAITNEKMVKENGHIYEIIVGDKESVRQDLTEKQLLFGPHLIREKPALFYQKWKFEHAKRKRIIDQMKQAALPDDKKIEAFRIELTWIEEELYDGSGYS